ncbi:hypothetical protein QQS21_003329 [Conoideocrella luteorostrata]|uniref:DUF7730 domain-containing protein n=1 Tax=Conoideocrella luteorostrata TaxID=1105319 RepID=A0AAJ0CTH1_9HYPO|nr:hypothetical protein QQS21_003329 [Conoideocrella luteorostrata]
MHDNLTRVHERRLDVSPEISDNHVLESDKCNDDDWELVALDEADCERMDEARRPILDLHWAGVFSLQIGGGGNNRCCTTFPESGSHDCKMPTLRKYRAPSDDDQTQCRLFQLPTELRLHIYKEVLSIKSPKVQLKWCPTSYRNALPSSVLSILETCRRIHAEAVPIFYSVNCIQYPTTTPNPSRSFFQTISTTRLNSIRNVVVTVSSSGQALQVCRQLTSAPKLQKLRVERQLCARYIDVRSWAVLAKQIGMELEKLTELQELELATPETSKPTPEEEQRMRRLDQIDASLQEVISRRLQ